MKVFGHEIKGKTVAITVGIGAALALLAAMMKKSPAQQTADDTSQLDVQDDSALGVGSSSAVGSGGAPLDPSIIGPLLSFEAQSQQNELLASIQQAQVAAAQQVQTLQANLNAKVASQEIGAQQNEAQISANTARTDTAISVGVPAIAGLLGKIFGGGGPNPQPGSGGGSAPSTSTPSFSGGGLPGSTTYAEEPFAQIASFGAFNLI